MNIENRTLFIAENLDIMRGIDSETVDLIYPTYPKPKAINRNSSADNTVDIRDADNNSTIET